MADDALLRGVAVIGFAGRFPGASSAAELWAHVCAGVDSVSRFTDTDLAAAGHDVARLRAEPGFVAARGVLDRPEWFDHELFAMSPAEAEITDPQQRVLLEVAWEALEHAGYDPRACPGAVGVYAGVGANTYYNNVLRHRPDLLESAGPMQELIGRDKDFVATRIAYKLNLTGPALSIHTACSTSLVTVCQAVQALLTYQCDMALAGGASIVFPQATGYLFEEGGIQSPDGVTRAFDQDAAGTVFSSGAGLVVLKRLEDALADRDRIHAVITGAALNNDGAHKASFTAPSARAHAELIAMAHTLAGVNARDISYVETHGTATPIGDPIEIAGLTEAFRHGTSDVGFCRIGSLKTNLGHLDIAAGVAGLIKTVMALDAKTLPPSLHFTAPNPRLALETSPFRVQTALEPWPGPSPRRAGVSSFGVGGTNAHVVVEEAPPAPAPTPAAPSTLLVLSARTPAALDAVSASLAAQLAADPSLSLADVAHTLRAGRHAFPHRRALVCGGAADAVDLLRAGQSRRVHQGHTRQTPRVAFMFPGGGAQYVGMGRGLLAYGPVFRREIERAVRHLAGRVPLHELLVDAPLDDAEAVARLESPATGLPALLAVEHALARQWMAWGVMPDALIGHSMGEYTAACLAGVMSLESALDLVLVRGRLFETLPRGGMVGVPLPESDVRLRLEGDLAIAAVNGPASSVVAGTPAALDAFARRLDADGIEVQRLHIAVAAHSPMVDAIVDEFRRFVAGLPLSAPSMPVASNLTGGWLSDADATSPDYWAQHLRQTVRFMDGLATLLTAPDRLLLEVGPGHTLGSAARQHPAAAGVSVLGTLRHAKDRTCDLAFSLDALGRAWASGVPVTWSALPDTAGAYRVPLATTPFERARHYADVPVTPRPAEISPIASASPPMPLPAAAPAPQPMAHAAPPPPPLPPAPRAERLVARLTTLLETLSGRPAAELDPATSFVELGFDSLFLTQASLRFKREFGVRVTFRQLFDDAPTISALAAFLDSRMPADAFPAPAAPAPAAVTPPALDAPAPAASTAMPVAPLAAAPLAPVAAMAQTADASMLERIVRDQLQVMREQLQLLGAAGAPTAARAAAMPAATTAPAATAPVAPARPAPAAQATPPSAATAATPAADRPVAFGPFKGIDKSSHGLTPHQQTHLDALIAAYTAKTRASKALTHQGRATLADPRAVTGFRKVWKEMVYQIATTRSSGSRVWDVDGHEYLDLTSSFGVNLFGFNDPAITAAAQAQLEAGIELGTLSPLAPEVATLICEITGHERATFANTGSEAIAGAIRAARTVTGRDWIVVFHDEYHGIAEEVLVRGVGAGSARRPAPAAPGIPDHLVGKVIVLQYDDPDALDVLRQRADEIAGVIVEPIQSRHPDFRPLDVLRAVRQVTADCDIPLIFDEMITGFRLHPRGAQGYLGIDADIVCYGKIMSGGLPIAAVAGRARYLDAFDGGPWQFGDDSYPEGGVTFFGGTFTRNALSLAASKAALLRVKATPQPEYDALNARSDRLAADLNGLFERHGAPIRIEHCGSIFVFTYADDNPLTRLLCYYLRLKGLHIWDRPFFLTFAHTDADVATVVRAFDESLAEMRAAHFLGEPGPATGGTPPPDVVPFTDAQMEVWLASQVSATASRSFNEVFAVDLHGPLQREALRRALDAVVARHESLRMTASAAPAGFRVAARADVPLDVRDLTAVPDETRDGALAEVLAEGDRRGFDLATGPMIRVTLVALSPEHHVLAVALHHLACDGFGFGVLMRDLASAYGAFAAGRAWTPAPAPSAAAYARDLAEAHASGEAAEAERYWRARYATLPAPLELPRDRTRPAVRTFEGTRLSVRFAAPLSAKLQALAAAHGTTMFVTLLTGFELLLHRLTGQTDFAIGVPVAGQLQLEDPHLVAHCVRFLPFRAAPAPDRGFVERLAAVRREWFDAVEHQAVTYGHLLTCLPVTRGMSRDPLVDVSFTVEPGLDVLAFAGLRVSPRPMPRDTAKRDLHVNVMETADGLAVDVDFDRHLFTPETVHAWLHAYEALLTAVTEHPDRPTGGLPLLARPEAEQMAAWSTGPRRPAGAPVTIPAAVAAQAQRTPDAVAVVCGHERLTYAELVTRAEALARVLAARGVGRGTIVALALDRSADALVATLAVLQAGGAYLPLDMAAPDRRLQDILADAQPGAIVTTARGASRIAPAACAVVLLDQPLPRTATTALAGPAHGDDLAYVMYTSGSTGAPKGVLVPHRAVVRLALGLDAVVDWHDVRAVLHLAPPAFDAATFEIWGPLFHGATVVVAPGRQLSLAEIETVVREHRVDTAWLTAALFNAIVDTRPAALDGVRRIITGGEALSVAHVQRAQEAWPDVQLVNGYGPTETTTFACCHAVPRPLDADARSVPIGRPIGGTRVHVVDAHGALVPPGVAGELWIGGDGVALGYLRRPELTAARFVPDTLGGETTRPLYRTGDRVRWRPDGTLEFLGRIDRQVKLRGHRIEPAEIEHAFRAAGARDAVVELEGTGEAAHLVAYVVTPAAGPTVETLRTTVAGVLPGSMIPAEIVRLGELPRTANGKLDRRAMPATAAAPAAVEAPGPPATATEHTVARLWAEVLRTPAPSRTDHFFQSGGHSLLAFRLIDRVRETLGVSLSPLVFFEAPRLLDLAAAIDRARPPVAATPELPAPAVATRPLALAPTPAVPVLTKLADGGPGAPFTWVHGIGGEVFSYLEVTTHLAPHRPVLGFAADWTEAFEDADRSVERIAAAYVAALVTAQPAGPYHLGGYCSAAVLMIEMARQLHAQGRSVGAFVVLDYLLQEPPRGSTVREWLRFARNLPHWLGDDALASGLGDLAARVRSKVRRLRRPSAAGTGDIRDELGLWRFPSSRVRMLEVHQQVLAAYTPQPIDARVTLLIPRAGPLLGPFPDTVNHGWDAVARQGIDVHSVPGSHSTFLSGTFAASVAAHIDAAIAPTSARRLVAAS